MKIRMLRNVLVEGEHCAVGDVVEVGAGLGEVLVRLGRAEVITNYELRITNEEEKGSGLVEVDEVETATRAGGKRRGKQG